jgi:hypothetical protein
VATGNPELKAKVVLPEDMIRSCAARDSCFEVSRDGSVLEIAPIGLHDEP